MKTTWSFPRVPWHEPKQGSDDDTVRSGGVFVEPYCPEHEARKANDVTAARIVDRLLADLSGRSGIGDAYWSIDRDVRTELRADWIEQVTSYLS